MMKTWKLDPNKTARENLWFVIDKFSEIKVNANRKLHLTHDERSELISEIRLCAYVNFMYKLRRGKYNRNFSFFQNVYSSVWSVTGNCLKRFIAQNRRRIDAEPYLDDLHTNQIDRMSPYKKRRPAKTAERQLDARVRDLEYEDYCGCCGEFGIVPMDYRAYCSR